MVGGSGRTGDNGIGRRSLLRGVGAVAVGSGLAGCSSLQNIERTYEAAPVTLSDEQDEKLGFRLRPNRGKRKVVTERKREVAGGITIHATVISQLRWYVRRQAGQVVFLSTPTVSFFGQEFNPLVKNSLVSFVRQRPDLLATMCGCPVGSREIKTADSLVEADPGSSVVLVDGVPAGGAVEATAFGETIEPGEMVGALTTGPYGREFWAAYTVLAAKLTHGDDTVIPAWVQAKIIGGRGGHRGGDSGDGGGGNEQIEVSGERSGVRGTSGTITEADVDEYKSDFESLLEEGIVEIDPGNISTGTPTVTTGTPAETTTPSGTTMPGGPNTGPVIDLPKPEGWDILKSPTTTGTAEAGTVKSVAVGNEENTLTLTGSVVGSQSGSVNPILDADLGTLLDTDLFYYRDRNGTVTSLPSWDLPPTPVFRWNGATAFGESVTVDGFFGLANADDGTVDAVVAAAGRVTPTLRGHPVALVGTNARTRTVNLSAPDEGDPLPDRAVLEDTMETLGGFFQHLGGSGQAAATTTRATTPTPTQTTTAPPEMRDNVTLELEYESTTVDFGAGLGGMEPVGVEIDEPDQSALEQQDENDDGQISTAEWLNAISDWTAGDISDSTLENVTQVWGTGSSL